MNLRYIEIEDKVKEAGFRNFASFYFTYYYNKDSKTTLKGSARILGVSEYKLRTSVLERNWPIKSRSTCSRTKHRKRRLYIWEKVKMNTPFIFPWCAINYYYNRCLLTTYEVGKVIGISQFSVIKLMNKYKMDRRKQGSYEKR